MRILLTPNNCLLYRVAFQNQLLLKKKHLNQGMFSKIPQTRCRERKKKALIEDGDES
jgi:hypothetical protein